MNGNSAAVCRLCLESGELLQDFFDPHENFVTIVEEFTGLEIQQEPNFPSNVCCTCLAHIDTLNNFKKTCLKSDKALREGLVVFEILIVGDDVKSEKQLDEALTAEDVIVTRTSRIPKIKSYEALDPLDVTRNSKPKPPGKKYKVRTKSEKQHDKAPATEKWEGKKTAPEELNIESDEASSSKSKLSQKKYDACRTPCHICGKLYARHSIGYHLNMHSGNRPFICPYKECAKTFTSPTHLSKHRRMCHTDQYRFACDVCGRSFKVKATLDLHRSYHFDPKLPCSVCGNLLRHPKALKRHMMSHTGERPYPCNKCSKSFQTNYTLKIHQRVHTKEKPFTCAVCARAFSHKCLLRTHMTSAHPETES